MDITERVYRLSSKVLKEVRDYSEPANALKNVLFAVGLSQDNKLVIPVSDDISNLISATRNVDTSEGKLLCALVVDSLGLLKSEYEKAAPRKSESNAGAMYTKHLNGILGKAEKICEEHKNGRRYDAENSAKELVSYTRGILGLDNAVSSRYSEKPSRSMDEEYLLRMSRRGVNEISLGEMEYDYGGALVAVDRKANRSTKKVGFTLTFRNERGMVNSVSVDLGSPAGKEPLDMIFYHLIPRAERNMRGLQPSEISMFASRTSRAREHMRHDGYNV